MNTKETLSTKATPERVFSIIRQVKGHWQITDIFHIASYKKPSRFHRFMCKRLLGWKWIAD